LASFEIIYIPAAAAVYIINNVFAIWTFKRDLCAAFRRMPHAIIHKTLASKC